MLRAPEMFALLSFVVWPRFSTSLKDLLGCSELADIFFDALLILNLMNVIGVLLIKFEYFLIF